jgi:hypothetical protein
MGFELTNIVVIGTDCTGSCKSNYHTITTTTVPRTSGQRAVLKASGRTYYRTIAKTEAPPPHFVMILTNILRDIIFVTVIISVDKIVFIFMKIHFNFKTLRIYGVVCLPAHLVIQFDLRGKWRNKIRDRSKPEVKLSCFIYKPYQMCLPSLVLETNVF